MSLFRRWHTRTQVRALRADVDHIARRLDQLEKQVEVIQQRLTVFQVPPTPQEGSDTQ